MTVIWRPLYIPGEYLSPGVLQLEQDYQKQRLKQHNHLMHGWGIVCGLWVVPATDPENRWSLCVCPGYALGPLGDEIILTGSICLDVREHFESRVHSTPRRIYVGIAYSEQEIKPVAGTAFRCDCDEPQLNASRVIDDVDIQLLLEKQKVETSTVDMCNGDPVECPECPESDYVILATISLPNTTRDPITWAHIDYSERKYTNSA